VNALVSGIDVAPTILAAAGVAIPETVQGRDLLAAAPAGEGAMRIAYAEALNTLDDRSPRHLPKHQKDLLFSAMDRQWKLIYHRAHPENSELYDLVNDPGEATNVVAEHPREKERLLRWLEDSGAMKIETVETGAPLDEASVRMLESLGYIGRDSDSPE
jgi:arylsulfatase A-like enzyme